MVTMPWGLTSMSSPYDGGAFHEGSGHFGVVVGHSSNSLEEKLELTLGGVGILVEDLFECFLASLPHGLFDGIDTAEGVFDQLVIVFLEDVLEGLGVYGVFGERLRDWSLVTWYLAFGNDFGSNGSVVTAELGFSFSDFDGSVRPDLEVNGLPRED